MYKSMSKALISAILINLGQNIMVHSMNKSNLNDIQNKYKILDQIIVQKNLVNYLDPDKQIAKNIIKNLETSKLQEKIKTAEKIKNNGQMLVDLGNEIYISIHLYLRLLNRELIRRNTK